MTITRFAPSPTGYLHRGHAFSALSAYDLATRQGGSFILRLEDIDQTRCRPQYEAAIYQDLAWLGLTWSQPVRRQSEHMADYRAALANLAERGLVYRCFRTRKEVAAEIEHAPHDGPDAYIGTPLTPSVEARRLANGDPYCWRLNLKAALENLAKTSALTFVETTIGHVTLDPDLIGDVILGRKDVGVAYHLAVTLDDALQGITHIVRGQDLFEATHVHRLLQALLALPTPLYHHHRLLIDETGQRLAKRNGSETLQSLRDRGLSPHALRQELGFD